MNEELERYSCQLTLPGFGKEAQELLKQARVLIVGMGGLGCPAATYLVSAGVGTIGITDDDVISVSNLHRQVLYNEEEVGQKKVVVAAARLSKQNPGVTIETHQTRVNVNNVAELIAYYDLIVDATDNFETHYLLNDACVMAGKVLVHGAIYQYEGHAAVWNMLNEDGTRSPNYRDVFPEANAMQIPDCADGGVLPTIAGIIGCIQANEAIKVITRQGEVLAGRMLIFDAKSMQSRTINIGHATKTNITTFGEDSRVATISKEALKKILGGDNLQLIDVRTVEEHALFNIGGINLPVHELEHSTELLQANKEIIFYCASGKRSMQAAKWLQEKMPGIQVKSLAGGINDWS
ncbi:MAG: HesA/MoeB/ThiF family protein [Bacteroidetes bacterium]|nr:HesA/MoeB/ThiF family protein [Bacteroidota bacterium]